MTRWLFQSRGKATMPQETTERTVFAPTMADAVPPRLEPIPFSDEEATDLPYFDSSALRELAARARGFAEMLSPACRRPILEKARRLEREAAQLEADTRP
jgi:hypothetical protein